MSGAAADPQARIDGNFATFDHPTLGTYETLQAPFRFDRSTVTVRGPAPELGPHTEEVSLEMGSTWEDIAALREQGADDGWLRFRAPRGIGYEL